MKRFRNCAVWFRLLRCRYRRGASHYDANRALEGGSMGFIVSQSACPDFAVGTRKMSGVGCEIAAAYNALRLGGHPAFCADIIRDFENRRYLMGAFRVGDLGSDPYAIGEYLRDQGISHTRFTDFAAMDAAVEAGRGTPQIYIVSFWNRKRITGGLHTAAFYTAQADLLLHVLNLSRGSRGAVPTESLSSFADSRRFIVGYRISRV